MKPPEAYSEHPGLRETNHSCYCHFLLHEDRAQSQIIKILSGHLSSGRAGCYWNALCMGPGWAALLLPDYTWGRVLFTKSGYCRCYILRQTLPHTPKCWQFTAPDPQLSAGPSHFQFFQIWGTKVFILFFPYLKKHLIPLLVLPLGQSTSSLQLTWAFFNKGQEIELRQYLISALKKKILRKMRKFVHLLEQESEENAGWALMD